MKTSARQHDRSGEYAPGKDGWLAGYGIIRVFEHYKIVDPTPDTLDGTLPTHYWAAETIL